VLVNPLKSIPSLLGNWHLESIYIKKSFIFTVIGAHGNLGRLVISIHAYVLSPHEDILHSNIFDNGPSCFHPFYHSCHH
jgi:hypothetical protein